MKLDKKLLLAGAALCLALIASATEGKEPEEIWRELQKLSGEERQKRLLSAAKSEGKVLFYVNLSADHVEPLRVDFEARYPGVKLEFWRGSGERTSNRMLTEARAQKFAVDVIGPGNEHLPLLMKANLLGRYGSPERKYYAAALVVDYLLSDAGQKTLAERGWFSGRRGIKPKYPELDIEGKGARVVLLRPEDAERFGKKYEELRERFLLRR